MPERAVITGLGPVAAIGLGAEEIWAAMLEGRRGVRRIEGFDPSEFPCQAGGELESFSARKFVPKSYRKSVKVMARDIEIAVAAADLAVKDANLTTRATEGDEMSVPSGRLGCNIGAGLICSDLDELGLAVNTAVTDGKFDLRKWGEEGMENLTPLWLLKYLPNMLACHVTIIHGAEGPSNTITCGDASGQLAVGEAARIVAQGRAQAVLAGGAESKLNPMGLLRQSLLKRLCTNGNVEPGVACRPFDAGHCGTLVGEGGAILVLESQSSAKQRGANIYAEVAGFGAACDPSGMNITQATSAGLDLAVKKAMQNAGIGPEDVDLIVAHGTGVPDEDACEAAAWNNAMGNSLATIPAVALSGAVGSLFAGAGGLEVATAALAIRNQVVPPTVNFETGMDGAQLQLATRPRDHGIRYAVSAAFAIGGQSAAVVLKRAEL